MIVVLLSQPPPVKQTQHQTRLNQSMNKAVKAVIVVRAKVVAAAVAVRVMKIMESHCINIDDYPALLTNSKENMMVRSLLHYIIVLSMNFRFENHSIVEEIFGTMPPPYVYFFKDACIDVY